ncbi:CotY/CotZ family spore coat protein [Halobacillus yeomjeoni]|uniref:Spore coat protein n=1 Tax=Halobacillus yeomjeoni TaxID=311194 RepID=A0A931HXJ3_9BACI|nr:CotY/CotZ family spore coat protein [Halobacillus yeomjeoni]MBH0231249.1 spore coat protein [Halobacillus yeomjeoni]
MSCYHSDGCKKDKCIRDIVRDIVKAQDEVAEREHSCSTSCEQSIRELLSPTANENQKTTIPVMLYTKDSEIFKAEGYKSLGGKQWLVKTKVFKVKKFVEDSRHCVKLELLKPIKHSPSSTVSTPCRKKHVDEFKSTGICITVDLKCFCGIACLEPITPEPVTSGDLEC